METNYLSNKQYHQLMAFVVRTRSYIVADELPIIKIIERCAIYCLQARFAGSSYDKGFISDLDKMMNRYYPYGYKENEISCSVEEYKIIRSLRKPRFSLCIFPTKIKPIEKILFIRTLRSCYKFLRSKYTEEDKIALVQTLESIRNIAIN